MNLPVYARTWILAAEGGYVNDPRDPGGETKFGISKRSYPMLDIPNLTEDDAAKIYARDYWKSAACEEYRPAIALAVFDSAVNQGVKAAVSLIQAAAGARIDGIPGVRTIEAINAEDDRRLLLRFIKRRWDRYQDTGGAGVFLRGWTRRLFDLEAACLDLLA